jgi:hypothetical protein
MVLSTATGWWLCLDLFVLCRAFASDVSSSVLSRVRSHLFSSSLDNLVSRASSFSSGERYRFSCSGVNVMRKRFAGGLWMESRDRMAPVRVGCSLEDLGLCRAVDGG